MSAVPDAAAQGANRANTLRIAARHAPAPPSLTQDGGREGGVDARRK